MNSNQESELHMNYVVRDFVDATAPAVIALMPDYSIYFDEFKENIIFLGDQLELQNTNRTGFAGMKSAYKETMIEIGSLIAAKIMGYASNIDDQVLYNEINYSENELRKMRDTDCKAACEIIYNSGTAHLSTLGTYFVTTADLSAFNIAIISYNVSIPKPSSQRIVKKEATTKIATTFSRNKFLLRKMDKLAAILRDINPEFKMGYFFSRKINKPASHPLAARFKVTDVAGHGIEKVTVACEELQFKRRTTVGGGVVLKNIADNVYRFTLSKAGFVSQSIEVAITRGERTDVFVTMVLNE